MSEWEEFRDRLLAEDPELSKGYERLGPLYSIVRDVIGWRHVRGLTQEQLAERMGKQQPAVARFESARVWPSLTFLQELAEALDVRLVVRLEDKEAVSETAAAARPRRKRKLISRI